MAANHANVILADDGGTCSNDRLVYGFCQTDRFTQAGDAVKFQLSALIERDPYITKK
jgi:hypothetical protein